LGRLLWLAFSGGEIFLLDDLVDIAKTFYGNNTPAIILLPRMAASEPFGNRPVI
jgi:hypothetical protein